MPDSMDESIHFLKRAFKDKNLTLYLGEGVSIGNNLPSWERLVLAMYFSKISAQQLGGWRPFSNYLFAIAEWYLKNSAEPLEITARKLQKFYINSINEDDDFLNDLYHTLYGSFFCGGELVHEIDSQFLRTNNSTLDAVTSFCESNIKGVRTIITYNYDSLLEIALNTDNFQTIYSSSSFNPEKIPIYHVHGYVPLNDNIPGSSGSEIVFTEDQYHLVARNPYHWSTLVQLQSMTNSVGLMIGLSLSDRNMRRLLDAVRNAPINSVSYALLKSPETNPPKDDVIDEIHKKAKDYLDKFQNSGIKSDQNESLGILCKRSGIKSSQPNIQSGVKGPRYRQEIAGIIEEVKCLDREQQQFVMEQLGIKPIWFHDYSEIPGILNIIKGS